VRKVLDSSPRSSMKSRSHTLASPRYASSVRSDVITPVKKGRHSISGPPSASTSFTKSFSEGDSLSDRNDDDSFGVDELNFSDFTSEPNIGGGARGLDRSGSFSTRSETFSPTSTSSVAAFGSRENRSSVRRYEMEHMQRRTLPEQATHESELEPSIVDPTPPPPVPPRQPGTPLEKLLANQNFGTREQRGSLRKIQRKSLAGSQPVTPQSSSPAIPRKDNDNNNTPSTQPTTNNRKQEKSDTWYEYGSV